VSFKVRPEEHLRSNFARVAVVHPLAAAPEKPFWAAGGESSWNRFRQYRKLLRCVWCRMDDGAVNEYGRGIPPSVLWIDRYDIPEYSGAGAAASLQSGQMLSQFLCNQMALVPELHSPWV
jgi:hypothetical protein